MNILVFAPHADDEILGCGGTLARHISEGDEVTVCIVTTGRPPIYDDAPLIEHGWPHQRYPEIMKAHNIIGIKETVFLELRCVVLESEPRNVVNGKIHELVQRVKPDIVYIPHFGDLQKDHTIVAQSVMVAVRPKYGHIVRYVYAYECLSETEWNIPHGANVFIPNVFVNISDFLKQKLDAINCYQSQLCSFPDPRSLEAVESLAKLRGTTMCANAAEAFMLVREYNT